MSFFFFFKKEPDFFLNSSQFLFFEVHNMATREKRNATPLTATQGDINLIFSMFLIQTWLHFKCPEDIWDELCTPDMSLI